MSVSLASTVIRLLVAPVQPAALVAGGELRAGEDLEHVTATMQREAVAAFEGLPQAGAGGRSWRSMKGEHEPIRGWRTFRRLNWPYILWTGLFVGAGQQVMAYADRHRWSFVHEGSAIAAMAFVGFVVVALVPAVMPAPFRDDLRERRGRSHSGSTEGGNNGSKQDEEPQTRS
jgi:hypothetical protein